MRKSSRYGLLRWMSLFAVGALAFATSARAESLADRLPAPALLYAEWSGADALAAQSADTPYGKLLADPGVAKLADEIIRAVGTLAQQQAGRTGG